MDEVSIKELMEFLRGPMALVKMNMGGEAEVYALCRIRGEEGQEQLEPIFSCSTIEDAYCLITCISVVSMSMCLKNQASTEGGFSFDELDIEDKVFN